MRVIREFHVFHLLRLSGRNQGGVLEPAVHGRGRRRLLHAGKSQKLVYCVLFLVSTIQDFCKFLFGRVRFLRMSHRFSQNGLGSSIPSCFISTKHPSDFEYTPELIFHMGSRDRDFSQISVSIYMYIYIYIFTESYEKSFGNAPSDESAPSARSLFQAANKKGGGVIPPNNIARQL